MAEPPYVPSPKNQQWNFDTFLHDVLEMSLRVMGADGGLIRLYEEETQELVIRVHQGVSENALKQASRRRKYGEGKCWQSVLSKQPLEGRLSDPYAHFNQPSGYRFIVPLLAKEKLIGTMSFLFREARDRLSARDKNLFLLIGNQIGMAVENANLMDQTQKKNEALKAFELLSKTVNQSLNQDQVLGSALDKILELFPCRFALLRIIDKESEELVLAAQKGLTPEEMSAMLQRRRSHSDSISWQAALAGKVTVIYDLQAVTPSGEQRQRYLRSIGCRGLVIIPLFAKEKHLGIISIGFHHPYSATGEELNIYTSIGQLIGMAIENAGLYREIYETNKRFSEVLHSMEALIYVSDMSTGEVLFINEYGKTVWGDVAGKICWQALQKDQAGPCGFCTNGKLIDDQGKAAGVYVGELQNTVNQRWYECRDRAIRWVDGRLVRMEIATDITERRQAEEERQKLQAQLVQAQKMESVGRLAGGVAHDFNNMLGVILGRAELALVKLGADHPLRTHLEGIQKAGQRSADLARQLLTFARKQTVAPQVLDLNNTVANMIEMLRRLIGEDIDLTWRPGADLWLVKIDPAQIDQMLANLCVNARDAITGVGKVTIETENVTFHEACSANHAEIVPGTYVMLAVSDDGCGMDKDVLDHLFEPFFTTKGVGQGTGLGLATVYGIVKQNEGFVNVTSEPEQGTTFKIYLPRCARGQIPAPAGEPGRAGKGGTETILLVEDEETLLDLGKTMLEEMGYTVMPADTPGEAIAIARAHAAEIHLLITDVVLPEMSGRELSERVRQIKPDLPCLFMSGYTADVIAHRGVLDEGVQFIQKPFSLRNLAAKVRDVLDT